MPTVEITPEPAETYPQFTIDNNEDLRFMTMRHRVHQERIAYYCLNLAEQEVIWDEDALWLLGCWIYSEVVFNKRESMTLELRAGSLYDLRTGGLASIF